MGVSLKSDSWELVGPLGTACGVRRKPSGLSSIYQSVRHRVLRLRTGTPSSRISIACGDDHVSATCPERRSLRSPVLYCFCFPDPINADRNLRHRDSAAIRQQACGNLVPPPANAVGALHHRLADDVSDRQRCEPNVQACHDTHNRVANQPNNGGTSAEQECTHYVRMAVGRRVSPRLSAQFWACHIPAYR